MLGWEYFKIRRRLEKIVKEKAGHVVGKPLDNFKTLHEKKTNANIKRPTHPMRHYFDSRRSNRSGKVLLLRTNTTRYKASFLPSTLFYKMRIIPVIKLSVRMRQDVCI